MQSDETTNSNIVSPHWGVFDADMMDLSNVEYEYINYKELNVTNLAGKDRYDIETRDKDSYILPNDGYLEVEYKIVTDAAGTAIPLTDKVAVQNCAMSLFKDAEYMIEDQRMNTLMTLD